MFYTKFNVKPVTGRIFDSHDDVDRLTYVDPSMQIKSFMLAGKNLALHRQATMYNAQEALSDNFVKAPANSVYSDDLVIQDMKRDELTAIVASASKAKNESANESLKPEAKATEAEAPTNESLDSSSSQTELAH